MSKDLNQMTLKELGALYEKHTGKSGSGFAKLSKAKAVERVKAVLPKESAAEKPARGTKSGKLLAALAKPRTQAQLLEATGYDARNLGVAISIFRGKGVGIAYDRETKRYALA